MPILDWLGKEEALKVAQKVPFRLLEPVPELSLEGPEGAGSSNLLIQGDNLEALKALLPFYAGRVKCIFIDPPYNTRGAFEHYDDNLEHSTWLTLLFPRLELLRELLSVDGSIWVTIDDNESHYLKVAMDEVFGRNNFVANIIWQKKYAPANDAIWLSDSHDHIFLYAKSKLVWRPNKLPRTEEQDALYTNPDDDPRGPWMSDNYTCAKNADERPNLYYPITNPNTGQIIWPNRTRVWAFDRTAHERHIQENLIWWGQSGRNRTPRFKKFLSQLRSPGRVPTTIWLHQEVGHNQDAQREQQALNGTRPFSTPKPEKLLHRIMHIASKPGDLVLDSFLGSGTTAAVAHKMDRRYIGIEMGEHAQTHCAPRLKKVIEGEQGGISEAVGWHGGGGFGFLRLGEALFDPTGLINPAVRFPQLASFVWFSETRTPLSHIPKTPLLGVHEGVATYLLFNGILGDRRPAGGNVLTTKVLEGLPPHDGPKVIFGEASRLGTDRLRDLGITFKQTPFDLKAR